MDNFFYFIASTYIIWIIIKETFELVKKIQTRKEVNFKKKLTKNSNVRKRGTEYVYFIYAPEVGRVKIGLTTTEVESRRKKLQTGSPCLLYTLGYIKTSDCKKLEKELHEKFKRFRSVTNNEFFEISPEIKDYVFKNCSFYNEDILLYEL